MDTTEAKRPTEALADKGATRAQDANNATVAV